MYHILIFNGRNKIYPSLSLWYTDLKTLYIPYYRESGVEQGRWRSQELPGRREDYGVRHRHI